MTPEEGIKILLEACGQIIKTQGRGANKTNFRTALLMGANAIKVLANQKENSEDEKIYVITAGCYSNYHIVGATTNKFLADEIKNKFSGVSSYDSAEIEEFSNAEILLKTGYFVRFDKAGNVIQITDEESDQEYIYADDYCGFDANDCFFTGICADSEEEAIKAAAEKRAMHLAMRLGI